MVAKNENRISRRCRIHENIACLAFLLFFLTGLLLFFVEREDLARWVCLVAKIKFVSLASCFIRSMKGGVVGCE